MSLKEIDRMKKAAILALSFCAMALTTAASSQTWVSNTGSDSNPCTIAAPCRTFARAVTVTPAWGQLSVLNPGDYGSVTITQAIRIDGGGFATNVATAGNNGITVNTPAGSVVQLHNLSIHGATGGDTGIVFSGSGGLDIDNVQITGFYYGILSGSTSQNLVVKDTTIENIASTGIYIVGPSATTLSSAEIINTHVRFANNGIRTQYAAVSVINSTFTSPNAGSTEGNFGEGIMSFYSNLYVDNCQINGYLEGLYADGGITQVNRSSFLNNANAVVVSPAVISNGSNTSFNNTTNLAVGGGPSPATMW
jgi:hypothetical protein